MASLPASGVSAVLRRRDCLRTGDWSRRVAVYGFPREYTGPKDETFSQDELDAVVTLAILGAPACWNPDYRPPTGDTKGEFLNEADPVTAWLETLPESWDRHPVMSTLDAYNASADEPVTIRTFGGSRETLSQVGGSRHQDQRHNAQGATPANRKGCG